MASKPSSGEFCEGEVRRWYNTMGALATKSNHVFLEPLLYSRYVSTVISSLVFQVLVDPDRLLYMRTAPEQDYIYLVTLCHTGRGTCQRIFRLKNLYGLRVHLATNGTRIVRVLAGVFVVPSEGNSLTSTTPSGTFKSIKKGIFADRIGNPSRSVSKRLIQRWRGQCNR